MTTVVRLPARTDVAGLAGASVSAVVAAAADLAGVPRPPVDPVAVALAYTAEHHVRLDGERPRAFADLSGFFRCRDGWVRTHANYPHHADRLRRALGLGAGAGSAELAASLASSTTGDAVERVTRAGGLCVAVAAEVPEVDALLRSQPLVRATRAGDAPRRSLDPSRDAPLQGVRVLDLTRVLAGPTATQMLALLGADVLRIDPPSLSEPTWQHLLTGHGKRSALLDIATPDGARRFAELRDAADVVVLGYRPEGLARLGLSPAALIARRPGLIVLQLRAWPDADRRGFDSLVQASSGIATVEGASGAPGSLPAQALDYSAGFLLAAEAVRLLARRAEHGGSWIAETSLRRVAAELLGRPRTVEPSPVAEIPDAHGRTVAFRVGGRTLVTVRPPFTLGGRGFAAPRPWGADEPCWN